MAYFGDSLAHSALLGVALGLVMGISTNLGTIIICSIFAVVLIWLQQKNILATDTLLGILAHSALSVGMVMKPCLRTVLIFTPIYSAIFWLLQLPKYISLYLEDLLY